MLFQIPKKEENNRKCSPSLKELQLSIFEYIERYYSSKRLHSSLGMFTSNEAEALYWEQKVSSTPGKFYTFLYLSTYLTIVHPQQSRGFVLEAKCFVCSWKILYFFVSIYLTITQYLLP